MLHRYVAYVLAAFYTYGALVHVANMLGLTGFVWADAPAKWQLLDISYFVLDVAIVITILLRKPAAIWLFWLAAFSQVCLYTLGRDWVLDVPAAFAPNEDGVAYLSLLVTFHIVSLLCCSLSVWRFTALTHSATTLDNRQDA